MAKRVVRSYEDITLTEVTLSDGRRVINRAYSVRTRNPPDQRSFGAMGAAGVYFDELVLRRRKPRASLIGSARRRSITRHRIGHETCV